MKIVLARKVWSVESVKYLLKDALQLRFLLKDQRTRRLTQGVQPNTFAFFSFWGVCWNSCLGTIVLHK